MGEVSGRINVFETRIPGRLNYDPEDTLNANIAYVLQDDVLVNMPLVAETDDTYRAAPGCNRHGCRDFALCSPAEKQGHG